MENCIYSIRIDHGLEHYLKCSKTGTYCKYQKYCSKKKTAINIDNYSSCSLLEKEGERMAKTKKVATQKVEKELQEEKHHAYYTVLIATPNYYILDINGSPTKIFGANNYKRGDSVEI